MIKLLFNLHEKYYYVVIKFSELNIGQEVTIYNGNIKYQNIVILWNLVSNIAYPTDTYATTNI